MEVARKCRRASDEFCCDHLRVTLRLYLGSRLIPNERARFSPFKCVKTDVGRRTGYRREQFASEAVSKPAESYVVEAQGFELFLAETYNSFA